MIYHPSPLAIGIFLGFVATVLGLSWYFARKTKSSSGYFAAGGKIHWTVNGVAFAGDYLSAASFLGICGMIATVGYDGFLYSIGYLAGWIVALFVVGEPIKRMGKYTFADAIDSKFNNRWIRLATAVSTLVVTICYLIPQMVGAGALVKPLLGLHHWVGVSMVGAIVIFIVATAGMVSTTYVQFLKGGLLVIFSTVIVIFVVNTGLSTPPYEEYEEYHTINATVNEGEVTAIDDSSYSISGVYEDFVKLENGDVFTWWHLNGTVLEETLSKTVLNDGGVLYNGEPKENGEFYSSGHVNKIINEKGEVVEKTGKLNIFSFLATINRSEVVRFTKSSVLDDNGDKVTIWYQTITPGKEIMRPGLKFKVDKGSTPLSKMNFVSLMLALFCGTAALPHILIRYYTVPSQRDARKSTILAIIVIGFFYILTLFMGLGAMVSGVLDVESSNMAGPLLARSFGLTLFAVISAIAFATILGTVSGLIVAASGAVAHDFFNVFLGRNLEDKQQVKYGRIAAIVVGVLAIALGVLFKGMNVSFLVGWAFAVAASANLPALLMVLFWKKSTPAGITSSIVVGMVSALTLILLSPSMFERYGFDPASAPIGLDNPGLISIPLSFLTLIVVSLLTQKKKKEENPVFN